MYYLTVKFVERSANSMPKTYTYMHDAPIEAGELVVVDVAMVARLVIVEFCTPNVPDDVVIRKYKRIRGTVNDQLWRTANRLAREQVKLEVEFEEAIKEHIKNTARRAIIGNDPKLLAMFNRIEEIEHILKDY